MEEYTLGKFLYEDVLNTLLPILIGFGMMVGVIWLSHKRNSNKDRD